MKITNQLIEKHGLKLEEYNKIKKLLKREPNLLELGIFSAMWNEHCSYKSSRIHLKKLPTTGKQEFKDLVRTLVLLMLVIMMQSFSKSRVIIIHLI